MPKATPKRPVTLKAGKRKATFKTVKAAKAWADTFTKRGAKFTITHRGKTATYQRT